MTDVKIATPLGGVHRSRSTTSRHVEPPLVGFDGAEPLESPWIRRNYLILGLLGAVGLIGLAIAWYGISDEYTFGDQIPWLIVGILSVVVGGAGAVYFLIAGARAVHKAMRDSAVVMRSVLVAEPELPMLSASSASAEYVTAPQMTRAHRPDCPQVRGKKVEELSASDVARLGLQACGVCAT